MSRDLFAAALEAEGIPCDGRFYEPVYRSDLFHVSPENCPQLKRDYSGEVSGLRAGGLSMSRCGCRSFC